jgi:hypothetical protein
MTSRAIRKTAGHCSASRHALEALGRTADAIEVRKRFEAAWARADVILTASAF